MADTGYSTGASWGFPDDLPGTWTQSDLDQQFSSEPNHEHEAKTEPTTAVPEEHDQEQDTQPAEQTPPNYEQKYYRPRSCRICLEVVQPTFNVSELNTAFPASMQPRPRVTYESPVGEGGRMIRPCKCKGSQKYVHEECLGAWRRQDPTSKRNYWQCPTCLYKYHLQRLTWGSWISGTVSQLLLTFFIFILAVFILGFVADPILNIYVDPVGTLTSGGGPTGSLIYDDEPATWAEHCVKGLASLGLLGFAKFLITTGNVFQIRNAVIHTTRGNNRGTGQARINDLGWVAILFGILTFLFAVWKGVRAWSRRFLTHAGERVMDVHGDDNDEDDDYQD